MSNQPDIDPNADEQGRSNPYLQQGKLTVEKKGEIVQLIREHGPRMAGIARRSNVSARTIERGMKADPYFEEAVREAGDEFVAKLEDELHRRAIEGVSEDQFYQGAVVGQIQRYSDSLLALAIKRRDHGYREKLSADVSIGGGVLVVGGGGNTSDKDWAAKFGGTGGEEETEGDGEGTGKTVSRS